MQSSDPGGENGSERGSTTAADGVRWSGPGKYGGGSVPGGGGVGEHLPGQRWSHGGRSPSPTPSTMSGCSMSANAPLSPSGGSDLSSSSLHVRHQALDPVHGYGHGSAEHHRQAADQWSANGWSANGADTDPDELLLGAEAMHPNPNFALDPNAPADGGHESRTLTSPVPGAVSSSSGGGGNGHCDAGCRTSASTPALARGAAVAGGEGSSLQKGSESGRSAETFGSPLDRELSDGGQSVHCQLNQHSRS